MKKIVLSLLGLACAIFAKPQSPDWNTSGNAVTATTNIFGTTNNYPIQYISNGSNRMKINGTLNYTVNGFNAARNGYVLMGINNNSLADGQNIYTQKGDFSLLHLNGEGETYKKERRLPQKQLSNQFVIFVHKQHILWH